MENDVTTYRTAARAYYIEYGSSSGRLYLFRFCTKLAYIVIYEFVEEELKWLKRVEESELGDISVLRLMSTVRLCNLWMKSTIRKIEEQKYEV